jgi:hypothetical protein
MSTIDSILEISTSLRDRSWVGAAAIAMILLAFPAAPARAGLLIDPAGGTDFTSSYVGYALENGSVYRSFGTTFNFYGIAETGVAVSTNGYLAFSTTPDAAALGLNRPIYSLAYVQGAPVIAPLYNDFRILDGTHLVDTSVAGHYYAVTYENMVTSSETPTLHAQDPAYTSTFQVALFTGDTVVNGFTFHSGDIAISYGAMNAPLVFNPEDPAVKGPTGTIGVAKDLFTETGLPTAFSGYITDLSTLPTGSSFFLYRPNSDQSSYSVSVASPLAVPEPASMAMLVIGLLPIAVVYRRDSAGRVKDA